MQPTVSDPHTSERLDDADSDDIERELFCSEREVSFGIIPFANLDFTRVVRERPNKGGGGT
jgi:hypothetical protein